MSFRSIRLKPTYAVLIALVINIWTSSNMNWGGDNHKSIIASDACGYYAYLPALFIYHDLQFSHFEKVEMSPEYYSVYTTQDYRTKTPDGIVDKYYVGCAVLWTPFFLAAHILAEPLGYKTDGYSKPYQIAISCASLFYLTLGLFFFGKLLSLFGFSGRSIFWSLLFTEFGTHLYYYAVNICSFSHVYSFSFVCLFLYFAFHQTYKPTQITALCVGALLGLIVVIRPVNVLIVLFLPFLADNVEDAKKKILGVSFLHWALMLFAFFSVLFIQLFIYWIQTGHFIVYSYSGERFYFLDPQFFNFLFSFRKGFFIYTPLFFFALLVGTYLLWRRKSYKAWALLIPFLVVVYVCSSWYCWWYGYSFSQRPMVDFMFVLSILICVILDADFRFKKAVCCLGFVLLLLNQFQIYQVRYGLILPDLMTADLYREAFLNVSQLIEKTN